jgi:cytochrome b subunit of formate dehydrogenase
MMHRVTPTDRPRLAVATVERNDRPTRWFHAAVHLCMLVLLGTGWWLWLGLEGTPSVLARVTGVADAPLHTTLGWLSIALLALGCALGWRAARTLLRDSVRFRRSDLRWFSRWPGALLTGRFGHHDGHFDPGQRLANLVMVASLLLLVGSGAGLAMVSGGPAFVWLNLVHRWSTYIFTPLVVGHIVIASGLLPGYRGVWRAMHLGGRLHEGDARRIWPGWTERVRETRR